MKNVRKKIERLSTLVVNLPEHERLHITKILLVSLIDQKSIDKQTKIDIFNEIVFELENNYQNFDQTLN